MQESNTTVENASLEQVTDKKRQYLRLSEIDNTTLTDLHAMFGLWKEADHCDKDIHN
jgi:hypothetical protein